MQSSASKKRFIEQYKQLVAKVTPKSKLGQGILRAYWVGGLICVLGQVLIDSGMYFWKLSWSQGACFASIVLVGLTALLTGIGVFDVIGKYAGAGSIVPITGFANSVVSPAMEFRREGLVMGVGAKLFTLAGPVLVYGISSSVIVGLITFFMDVM